jgi:hypothetical protein
MFFPLLWLCCFALHNVLLYMEIIITSEAPLSFFEWLLLVTAFLFLMFLLATLILSIKSINIHAKQRFENFIEEETNTGIKRYENNK